MHLGADKGAKILIEHSSFEYSRFCKGLIVYREGVDFNAQNPGVFSFQKEASGSQIDQACTDCQIILYNSTFTHLNHGTRLRTLRPLLDYRPDVRNSTRLDSSGYVAGAISAPIFQNHAAVLNLQDFRGTVQVKDCDLNQNLVNIPDIIQVPRGGDNHNSIDIDHFNVNFYMNSATNLYELAICETDEGDEAGDVYLLTHGIFPYLEERLSMASLYNTFERHAGAVYISRPTKPVILTRNTFKENIGLFGGAVSINSPNFAALEDPGAVSSNSATVESTDRPYLILN